MSGTSSTATKSGQKFHDLDADIPQELKEAARIDGCGPWRTLLQELEEEPRRVRGMIVIALIATLTMLAGGIIATQINGNDPADTADTAVSSTATTLTDAAAPPAAPC